jgi:hypothetical protein
MAISTQDNYKIMDDKPIDNRFVIGVGYPYENKEDIEYKYEGLRIWDKDNSKGWIWYDSIWNEENVSPISANGTDNYVAKFGGTDELVDSIIRQEDNKIAIGLASIPSEKLVINGTTNANNLIGVDQGLLNLSANNITTGELSLDRIQPGDDGDILVTENGTVVWKNESILLSVSDQSNNIYHSLSSENTYKRCVIGVDRDSVLPTELYSEIRTTNVNNTYDGININTSNNNVRICKLGVGVEPDNDYSLTVDGILNEDKYIINNVKGLRVN